MGRLRNDPFREVHSDLLHPLFLALAPDGSTLSWVLDRRRPRLDPVSFGPCRVSESYEHRRNYRGKYPFGPARMLVGFESLIELVSLMELDHSGEIISVVDQPFGLKFPDGSVHYPDFAAALPGGGRLIVDVKPADLATNDGFVHVAALTETVCRTQGWGYRVMQGCTGWKRDNLEWLCGYRYDEYAPASERAEELGTFLAIPRVMEEAALHLDARVELGVGYAQLFNLMFHRRVVPAEPGPFYPGMLVVAGEGGKS